MRGKLITKYISSVNVNIFKELNKKLATRAISADHLASSLYLNERHKDIPILLIQRKRGKKITCTKSI